MKAFPCSLLQLGSASSAIVQAPSENVSHAKPALDSLAVHSFNGEDASRQNFTPETGHDQLPLQDQLMPDRLPLQELGMPGIFVAIFTSRSTPKSRRDAMRELWREVDGGSGSVCARFALCKATDENETRLRSESAEHGDLLFLDCSEGYFGGKLTRKVISVAKAYRHAAVTGDACMDRPLLMKVDDDTFVASRRFRQQLSHAVANYGSDFLYAGVEPTSHEVIRDQNNKWYEPLSTWPLAEFPRAMYGGTGYILGRQLVQKIIDESVADANVLWNEDRAVGVWVHKFEQRGVAVHRVNFAGTNGFWWDHFVKKGSWREYPYALHHRLSKESISCLLDMDRRNNPDAQVDNCFSKHM